MKRKFFVPIIAIVFAVSVSACSGTLALDLPDIAEPENADVEAAPTDPEPASEPPVQADVSGLAALQDAYISIYDKVIPSVVSIQVTKTVTGNGFELPFDFDFDFETPEEDEPFEYQESAAGSGFVWDKEGHIVTNNHVIEGGEVIRVNFADGRSVLAELVGADADSDLAVLKIDMPEDELTPISITDSTKVKVGQIAVAIGNPFQLASSMTTGIISGVGRSLPIGVSDDTGLFYTIPDVIQTDAAINPGNSGGVLVDINGNLIGVTTAIESPVRANSGVGYVIPSIIVNKIVPILIEDGEYEQPWIGISGLDMNPEFAELMDLEKSQRGALVIDVTPNSPADKAGLIGSSVEAQVDGQDVTVGGDVIIAADNMPIDDFEDLVAFLARYTIVGQEITLIVIRDGAQVEVPLTLSARRSRDTGTDLPEPEEVSDGAWLGIAGVPVTAEIAEAMDLDADIEGVLIATVTAGSPADAANLRGSYKPVEINGVEILVGGDIITAVDGEDVADMDALAETIADKEPGDEITLTFLRDGESDNVDVTLGEKP